VLASIWWVGAVKPLVTSAFVAIASGAYFLYKQSVKSIAQDAAGLMADADEFVEMAVGMVTSIPGMRNLLNALGIRRDMFPPRDRRIETYRARILHARENQYHLYFLGFVMILIGPVSQNDLLVRAFLVVLLVCIIVALYMVRRPLQNRD